MSRWGEEEKKSKGIFGCLVAFGVLFLFSYTFYINYQKLEGRRKLEKQMQTIVRRGYSKSEAEMRGEILDWCEKNGVELLPEDLELSKTYDDYNNPVVDVWIRYNFKVDLLITELEIPLPISEDVTIVVL